MKMFADLAFTCSDKEHRGVRSDMGKNGREACTLLVPGLNLLTSSVIRIKLPGTSLSMGQIGAQTIQAS